MADGAVAPASDGEDGCSMSSAQVVINAFDDPLGVCRTDIHVESDDYDFDQYYLSQISPSSTRILTDSDGSLLMNFKKPVINKDISYLSLCKDNQCDSLLDSDKHDLTVTVDNPEKHVSTMESFITYRITTTCTRPEYENKDYQVRRRYNDFLWLRQQLEEHHPMHIVPPLPEKHSFRRLDRFSQDFVNIRMLSLNTFLQRLTKHPVLSFNQSLQSFLTNKQWEFVSMKSKDSSTIMSRLAGSIQNLGSSFVIKNRPKEFTDVLTYLNKLQKNCTALRKLPTKF
ncbi:hypothetical protein HELRODRAFT_189801 [Helobdella robusta]|uniref:PX domain-containing protein n=1 Tax=Helobdella robusta TaxID=6412 RepID=T1FRD6_HELRO|nr:hypothetical protein HELRODRAFT_189801 [Helobdella robusta]ESN91766.1 hypothetical protein HELRODRAFT_189801 [Helobdella robusta]